jgi:hypothetical protein
MPERIMSERELDRAISRLELELLSAIRRFELRHERIVSAVYTNCKTWPVEEPVNKPYIPRYTSEVSVVLKRANKPVEKPEEAPVELTLSIPEGVEETRVEGFEPKYEIVEVG